MRLRTFGGLWIENGGTGSDSGARPRGLALLALLASGDGGGGGAPSGPSGLRGRGLSRDRVLGILWPESDPERARHALSQTIYGLRRALGAEVVLSTPELRIDTSRVTSDVDDFRSAVRAKRWADAAALYVGPFLDGFYLADAPEFERWVERERATLAADGVRAIESVANDAERSGDLQTATAERRRLTLLDPVDSRFAVAYMASLTRQGNREAALAHGKTHVALLQREFDAEPDPAVQELMERLRLGTPTSTAIVAVGAPPPGEPIAPQAVLPVAPADSPPLLPRASSPRRLRTPTAPPAAAGVARRPRSRLGILGAALAIVAVTAGVAWRAARGRDPAQAVLAVGQIRDLVVPDSAAVGAVLSEMLATSLGRIGGLQVVANSRMLELTPHGDTSHAALTEAGRRAGATEFLEGELIPLPDRQLRLEIRRVDLRNGLVLAGYRLSGSDRFTLFDSVTSLIASDFRMQAPSGSLGEVSTRSPIAYRFYDEGLQSYYQSDPRAALRLFRSAVREDSTFAMATYYTWRAARATGDSEAYLIGERVLALAPRAARHDRLLMLTHVGGANDDPSALVFAESLATSYPSDPEALVRAGEVVHDLPSATRLVDRSIALDSAAGVASPICRMCDAFTVLFHRYTWADSSAAAERTLQRWIRLRPTDGLPWCYLSDLMLGQGRSDRFDTALRRCEALGGSGGDRHLLMVEWALRLDDFDAQNRECRAGVGTTDPGEYEQYRWLCEIALRGQGNLHETLTLARDGRAPSFGLTRAPPSSVPQDRANIAIALTELGQGSRAVPLFRGMFPTTYSLNGQRRPFPDGVRARNTAWEMTLAATAAVAGGDTTLARAYVDSIAAVGQRSSFERDAVLHHFVRGLLDARAGRQEQAVAEFRQAVVSPTFGYTRINYEMGRSLLALRRPAEAIRIVQPALRGGIDGSNLYVTRTELHELLGQAFAAAGRRDSAAAHFAVVERAWRSADALYRPRYEAARQYLAGVASRRDSASP